MISGMPAIFLISLAISHEHRLIDTPGLPVPARRLPAVEQRPLAPAVVRRINGEAERDVAGFLDPPDDFRAPIQAAANIQLKNFWMVDARGNLFERRLGHRAEKVHRAELRRRFGHATPPSGVIVCSEPIGAIITGIRNSAPGT